MRPKKLDEEIVRINKSLEPVRDGWVKYGCSILSDGWSDRKKEELSTYLSLVLLVGPNNIIQVITDNASNCKSMARKLEEDYPSIVWTPCASHCLDLLMEDIGSLSWVKSILTQALSIVTFIYIKVRVLAIYRTYSDLELLKSSSTRFAYIWIVLERLVDVQNKIQKTMVSDEFKEWLEAENCESKQEAKTIQRLTLKEEFWAAIKGVVVATLPIYKVLQMTDMEGSTMGLLYHFMEDAFKEIEKSTILDGVPDGTRYMYWKTHQKKMTFFFCLKSAYKRAELFANQELKEQMFHFLPKIVSEEHHGDFLQQLINYGDQRGSAFSSSICWKRESLVKPLFWWESFGFQLPYIQKVALRILGQDCSSGACERNWSAYSLIHTKIRNKLPTKQLERLIYCRSNPRMLRCMHEMPMARQSLRKSIVESLVHVHTALGMEEVGRGPLYIEVEEFPLQIGLLQLRRGSGSGCPAASTMENIDVHLPTSGDLREPEYDDEGNLLSDGDYDITPSCNEDNDHVIEEEDEENDL
ncbi:hypothetical protein KP509_16G077800 [Ceratopteris richardii]|uniref:DUF659 domain-containing protein n=1 Tax=Ceratopteris richardii TaxID=49495 RepID=A0A8T2T052_CERRI|nr:hypothetical protein KP509_16G077800 [Ceratopteris richardii]